MKNVYVSFIKQYPSKQKQNKTMSIGVGIMKYTWATTTSFEAKKDFKWYIWYPSQFFQYLFCKCRFKLK